MKKKIIAIVIVSMFLLISSSAITGAADKNQAADNKETTVSGDPEQIFTVDILSAFYRQGKIPMEIEISGYEKLTDITVEFTFNGKYVVSWTDPMVIKDTVENYWQYYNWMGMDVGIDGFGPFTVTVKVTCNEGLETTDTASGIMWADHILLLRS